MSASLTPSSDDLAALHALQRGDDTALDRLIVRWQEPLHRFAYRYVQNAEDAHDLVAEAFVRLYQQRARLHADTHLSAWLFTILVRLCFNHSRWQRRHPTVALESAVPGGGEPPGEQLTPSDLVAHDETLAAVRLALARLPHELKTTLLLHHYEHLSYREIGAITGCSERGVETRLYRARRQLRQLLAPQLDLTIHDDVYPTSPTSSA